MSDFIALIPICYLISAYVLACAYIAYEIVLNQHKNGHLRTKTDKAGKILT